ncbi:MAG: ABC transporter permease [Deltaproteobacteria bacterium]|nr:MAG: ABC transporter permease [Deltaproteobacteria bacterium]
MTDRPATDKRTRRRVSPLMALTWARILVFVREPGAIFWVFVFPVLLAIGLGVAFREQPPEPARVAVDAADAHAAELTGLLAGAGDVRVEPLDRATLETRLAKGSVDLVVTFTPPDRLDYRYDPSRGEARIARLVVDHALQRALGREDVATLSEHTEIPPGSRYIDFLLPGLIAMNLMGSGLWGVGYAVVQERKGKLLKRFAVTPMRRSDFLLSFILSRLVFLVAEVVALIGFGALAFDVDVQGSALDVAVLCFVGGLSFTGISVLVASRTSSVEVASGLMNLVMLPMYILSGTFFSYERFPEALHPVLQALPLTALNDALRAVMNDGQGIATQLPELAVLGLWGVLPFAIALKIFRWK